MTTPGEYWPRRAFLAAGPVAMAAYLAARDAQGAADTDDEDSVLVPANYYQHFDADYTRDVPEEGCGGWKKEPLPFSRRHSALVVMHAWDAGTREAYPGWHRAVPYLPRSAAICRDVFTRLLPEARGNGFTVFHVVGGGDYYKKLPGYLRAVELAGPEPPQEPRVPSDPVKERLNAFRNDHVFPGKHNVPDIEKGFARLDFPEEARPAPDEGVAENGRQLTALCRDKGINHLVYAGFAVNWCLLLSPGGMAEMAHRHGAICSVIREATTAVENRESAREQRCKELALWRISLAFGFVYELEDFLQGIKRA